MIDRLLTLEKLEELGGVPSPCEEYRLLETPRVWLVYERRMDGAYSLFATFRREDKPIDMDAMRRGGL